MIAAPHEGLTPQQELQRDFLQACLDPQYVAQIQDECRASFLTFVDYYHISIGWTTTRPQRWMASWLQSSEHEKRRIIQAYRHSSKSHIASLYVLWRLLCDPMWTVIIIAANEKLARKRAQWIRNAIVECPLLKHMKPNDPDHWKKDSFSINRPYETLEPSVDVSAVTSGTTGGHAAMLLLDDVEIMENSKTEFKREEVWEKVQSFMSLSGRHLYVGTPHAEDSIYVKLLNSRNYHAELRIPAQLPNGEMANPDVMIEDEYQDEAWLKSKEFGMPKGMYRSQFFLEPMGVEESILQVELIKHNFDEFKWSEDPFADNYFQRWQFFLGNIHLKEIVAYFDPASGLKGRDDSVVAVAAMDANNNIYLLHVRILSPVLTPEGWETQCSEVIETCVNWGVGRVYVERNAHPMLYHTVSTEAKKKKARLFVKEALRGPTKSKNETIIDALELPIRAGRFHVRADLWKNEPKLRSQFQNFPGLRHDDVIDAVAGAVSQLHLAKGVPNREKDGRPMINTVPKHGVINKYVPARWQRQ